MKLSKSSKDFFTLVVIPNCVDFASNPTNIRLAANAVIAINHMIDWVANEQNIKFKKLKEKVEAECASLKALRELANGVKHPGDKNPALAAGITYEEASFSWKQANFTWEQASEALSIPTDSVEVVKVVSKLIDDGRNYWTLYFESQP